MNTDSFSLASSLLNRYLAKNEKLAYSESSYGKACENAAKALTRLIRAAIKENNIFTLLRIEKNAIKCDIASYGSAEKRTNALASLQQAIQLVTVCSTPEGAKEYLTSMNDGILPDKIPKTDLVGNFVKNQKAQINQLMDATASQALKHYFYSRKEALEHVRNEYIKNLNHALGKENGKDNEISR